MQAFLGIPDLDRPAPGSVAIVPLWVDQLQRFVPRALTGATLSGFTVNQVPVGTSGGGLAGTSAFTFNGTTLAITGAATISTTLLVSGAATFSSTAGVTGILSVTNATAASSTSTGAVVVTGGAGIGGALYAGSIQNTPIGSTTRSTALFTTLGANGAATFSSTVDVTGAVTFASTVSQSGTYIDATSIPNALDYKHRTTTTASNASRSYLVTFRRTCYTGQTDNGDSTGLYFQILRNSDSGSVSDNGTVNRMQGVYLQMGSGSTIGAGTPVTNNLESFVIDPTIGTGSVGTFYGLWLKARSGAGTITTMYGVKQDDTAAINLYAGTNVFSTAALATNATVGFLYLPTCAGTPTGVPTAFTGTVAHVYDTTNNKLYVYNGAWKATAALT